MKCCTHLHTPFRMEHADAHNVLEHHLQAKVFTYPVRYLIIFCMHGYNILVQVFMVSRESILLNLDYPLTFPFAPP